ncbi:MAG: hypothetical protein A3F91_09905 [Flavobacteria bacterium RIFCSPLOWO2_12_FULL_35_11]|nr:MAG: hypothetical protein A3F91_09905 [Flavobacteria bacterium RIFCSPLOWO2_12_FULL_35_11]
MSSFKKIITFLLVGLIGFTLVGCSGKSRVSPDGGDYELSAEEKLFASKKEVNEQVAKAYERGRGDGYNAAKVEFEKILPYIEAIRASAELKDSGGLCMPPLFLDKSSGSSVAIVLGEAHVCENFTVENVLSSVKSGIPGLPKSKSSENLTSSGSISGLPISNVSIAGTDKKNYFVEPIIAVQEPKKIRVEDTLTNRQILRDSKFSYSAATINDENFMIIEFKDETEATGFCKKYSICK